MPQIAHEVRAPRDAAEQARLAEIIYQSFAGFGMPPERTDVWLEHIGRANLRIILLDGRIVGGLGILFFGQWFGGRAVASAGISVVAIAPEDRISGAGALLMNGVVRELAERGVPLSVLYPSTHALYRKSGYEPAGFRIGYKLDLRGLGPGGPGVMRPMVDADAPAVEVLHRERARRSGGCVERTELEWRRIRTYGLQRIFAYVVQSGGAAGPIDGYLIYTQEHVPRTSTTLQIRDWAAATPAAAQRLLGFLRTHTTMAREATFDGGPTDVILRQAREEYVQITDRSTWMLRVVNARAALEARGYPPGVNGEVHFELRDELLPANQGRFILRISQSRGETAPGGAGRVRLGVHGLAPLFSGQNSALELQSAGLIEGDESDLAAAGVLFAGPAPWMSDRF